MQQQSICLIGIMLDEDGRAWECKIGQVRHAFIYYTGS